MGTSSSNKGPRPGSPLVPPWADPPSDEDEPSDPLDDEGDGNEEAQDPPRDDEAPNDSPSGDQPAEEPLEAQRPLTLNLTGFRRTLGNAVSGGSGGGLRKALRTYAKATGGGGVAARRLGSPLKTGGRVHSLFGTGTATGPNGQTLTLASLDGLSVRVALDRIVSALVPMDGERDKVAAALQHALSTALGGAETFDQSAITPDVVTDVMVVYLRDVIFQTVISDSGRAFQRSEDLGQIADMERGLLALVDQVVNDQGRAPLAEAGGLDEARIVALEARIVAEVWDVWESSR